MKHFAICAGFAVGIATATVPGYTGMKFAHYYEQKIAEDEPRVCVGSTPGGFITYNRFFYAQALSAGASPATGDGVNGVIVNDRLSEGPGQMVVNDDVAKCFDMELIFLACFFPPALPELRHPKACAVKFSARSVKTGDAVSTTAIFDNDGFFAPFEFPPSFQCVNDVEIDLDHDSGVDPETTAIALDGFEYVVYVKNDQGPGEPVTKI